MPLKGFKYPNGEKLSIEDVYKGNVDIGRIGVSIPTLLHMSSDRDPERKPSATELLSGTCESYLKRKEDYYIVPNDNAFSLAGTLHHLKLEDSSISLDRLCSEIQLESRGITGIIDLYDKKTHTLIDYKFSGSYKVAKCLGIQWRHTTHPTEVYKRNSKWGKKGEPKRIKEFYIDENTIDMEDWSWQINFYRYLLESNLYPVDRMLLQVTVRDGGLQIARERGVDKNIYILDVPYINNDHLIDRYTKQRDALLKSLKLNELPSKCSTEETWGGKKCESYCDVRHVCPYNKGVESE